MINARKKTGMASLIAGLTLGLVALAMAPSPAFGDHKDSHDPPGLTTTTAAATTTTAASTTTAAATTTTESATTTTESATTTTTPRFVTLCHVPSDNTDPVTLTIAYPAAFGPAGHFNEDGTPQAGHEDDYLGECVESTTTTVEETTTTVEETTTTVEETTTTVEETTTTVEETTTTVEETTTTVEETTTTAEETTTTGVGGGGGELPKSGSQSTILLFLSFTLVGLGALILALGRRPATN